MARKVSLPSVTSLNNEGLPFSTVMFLQAVEDGVKTIDDKVVYRDSVTVNPRASLIRSGSAQGQAFSISGTNVASGDDYVALISDFRLLLQSHLQLQQDFTTLVSELRGN